MRLGCTEKPGYWLIFLIGLLIIGCEKTTRLVSDYEINDLSDSTGTYFLSRVKWITSCDGNIFVPELKDCLVFRIDHFGGLVDFVDLRELFGTFSLGQVSARDSMIYLINITSRCLHILNLDFSEAGVIKMPHSQLNLGRLYFFKDGFTGFGAGKVLSYGYSGDTVTLLSAIPQNDSLMIRSGHIFKKGGYTYLVSEEKPLIKVFGDSSQINVTDFSNVLRSINRTIMRNEALAASKKNFTQEIINLDATLAEDRLLILVSKKASSGKTTLNTILVFHVNGPEINFQKAFRLSGSEYFQTITLSGDYLIAAYPENRNFLIQYFNIGAKLK